MSTRATHRGIIVGVDGSPASKVAVDWAARDAAIRKIPLTVVNVRWQEDEERTILNDALKKGVAGLIAHHRVDSERVERPTTMHGPLVGRTRELAQLHACSGRVRKPARSPLPRCGREHRDAELVAAELAVARRCRRCRWPAARRDTAVASTDVVEVDGGRPRGCARPGRRRTAWRTARPRPSRRWCRPSGRSGRRPTRGRRCRASTRPAGRRGRSWRAPACCRSGRGGSCSRAMPRSSDAGIQRSDRRDALDALDRGRRARGEPQAAVAGEALLRGEVVDVELRRGRSAGRRRPTWRRRATSAVGARRAGGAASPRRSRSRCG